MYQVFSPDGFPIERDAQYATRADATKALRRFISRYTLQGYYSTSNRERIALADIPSHCHVQKSRAHS